MSAFATQREYRAHPHFETTHERGREAFQDEVREFLRETASNRPSTGRVLHDLSQLEASQ